jgi:predicted HD superfamily hydrolase involved in NAD metabolism
MDSIFRNEIINYLKKSLPPERFRHIIGTTKVAIELAKRYAVKKDKAETAALLHDCARGLDKKKLIAWVKRHRLFVPERDRIIKFNPYMLHSFVSADMARTRFKIRDKHILNAIAFHTTANIEMNTLEKIIYVSDFTSPDRRYHGADKIRWWARRSLEKAYKLALKNKIEHVLYKGQWIHPYSVNAWNSLIK